ncbi:hypothetical protein D3C77_689580 [compost metagenome]
MLELMVLDQQQQGLEHRDGKQPVSQNRQQDVRENARFFVDQRHRARWRELRGQRRQHA